MSSYDGSGDSEIQCDLVSVSYLHNCVLCAVPGGSPRLFWSSLPDFGVHELSVNLPNDIHTIQISPDEEYLLAAGSRTLAIYPISFPAGHPVLGEPIQRELFSSVHCVLWHPLSSRFFLALSSDANVISVHTVGADGISEHPVMQVVLPSDAAFISFACGHSVREAALSLGLSAAHPLPQDYAWHQVTLLVVSPSGAVSIVGPILPAGMELTVDLPTPPLDAAQKRLAAIQELVEQRGQARVMRQNAYVYISALRQGRRSLSASRSSRGTPSSTTLPALSWSQLSATRSAAAVAGPSDPAAAAVTLCSRTRMQLAFRDASGVAAERLDGALCPLVRSVPLLQSEILIHTGTVPTSALHSTRTEPPALLRALLAREPDTTALGAAASPFGVITAALPAFGDAQPALRLHPLARMALLPGAVDAARIGADSLLAAVRDFRAKRELLPQLRVEMPPTHFLTSAAADVAQRAVELVAQTQLLGAQIRAIQRLAGASRAQAEHLAGELARMSGDTGALLARAASNSRRISELLTIVRGHVVAGHSIQPSTLVQSIACADRTLEEMNDAERLMGQLETLSRRPSVPPIVERVQTHAAAAGHAARALLSSDKTKLAFT